MNYQTVWPEPGPGPNGYPRAAHNSTPSTSNPNPSATSSSNNASRTSGGGGVDDKNCQSQQQQAHNRVSVHVSPPDQRNPADYSRPTFLTPNPMDKFPLPPPFTMEQYKMNMNDDDNLLKVATHFLSSHGQGRHLVPLSRDYPHAMYVGAPPNYGPPLSSDNNHRPASRGPGGGGGGGTGGVGPNNLAPQSSSASSAPSNNMQENAAAAVVASRMSAGSGTEVNPLMSPCSVMEDASSPSSGSQLSYVCSLQSPQSALNVHGALGLPAPFLLKEASGNMGTGGGGGAKKKSDKPGSDVRSFGCQVCGRGFKQKATLTQHERTHTDERPFDCPDCHKRFRQQSHLVQHLRIHSDERPYSCSYCDKAFRQKAILNQHVRIHTGEKPYVCPQCTKCFRQKAILNQHVRTHSGKRPFSCPDAKCKKKFVDQQSMEKHFKKHLEEDEQQLLGGPPPPRKTTHHNRGGKSAKGLLRVKLNNERLGGGVGAGPGGAVCTQDRATSPFPISMMMKASPPDRSEESNPLASEVSESPQQPQQQHPHQQHGNGAGSGTYLNHAHQALSPYQFVPFPHRPYPYDLLSMQGGPYASRSDPNKYRDLENGHHGHLTMDVPKDSNCVPNYSSTSSTNAPVPTAKPLVP